MHRSVYSSRAHSTVAFLLVRHLTELLYDAFSLEISVTFDRVHHALRSVAYKKLLVGERAHSSAWSAI